MYIKRLGCAGDLVSIQQIQVLQNKWFISLKSDKAKEILTSSLIKQIGIQAIILVLFAIISLK